MADETQKELANGLDQVLLDVIKNGQTVIDSETGEPVRVTPSAAMLNVIRQRVKDCGVTAVPTAGSPVGNIIDEMRKRGMRVAGAGPIPPIDTDSEDAATA